MDFSALVERISNPPEKQKIRVNVPNIEDDESVSADEPRRKIPDDLELPNHFCCPITLELMDEPVIAPSGYTYERRAIEEHLRKNASDPFTLEPFNIVDLRPNRALRDAIQAYKVEHNL